MDEATFQRELIQLKSRISQMAASYQPKLYPRPMSSPLGSDAFGGQLQDVKHRLLHMQLSLDRLNNMPRRSNERQPSPHIPATASYSPEYVPQNKFALPSGPLFWQLFTSLRTDVRGLSSRVSDLEQNVSDLDDRMDNVDPRYTPPGSDVNTCDFLSSAQPHPLRPSHEGSIRCDWMQSHARPEQNAVGGALQSPYGMMTSAPDYVGQLPVPLQTSSRSDTQATEGVAFRDKEITRLEELMRGNQEDLQMSEEGLRQKDAEIHQFRLENGQLRARVDELEFTVSDREGSLTAYSDLMAEKEYELEDLRTERSAHYQRLMAWEARNYNIKQNYLRKKTQLADAEMEIQQLQHDLHRKQEEIDDAVNGRDEEIYRLREFCESKDVVVRQQKDIIDRGASLIQDRDDALERTTRELKILRDDYENECRERERFARLFEERGKVIEELRASLDDAHRDVYVPNPESPLADTRDELGVLEQPSYREHAYSPEPERPPVHAGEQRAESPSPTYEQTSTPATYAPLSFATVGKEPRNLNEPKWSPQPIRGNVRTFNEQQRANLWESGPFSNQGQFGVPGYTQTESPLAGRTQDLRRSDSVRLLRRLAFAEEGTAQESRNHTMEREYGRKQDKSLRNKRPLPLEPMSIQPPLPAPTLPPLPPRRHGSHADLPQRHSRQLGDDTKPMSKHMSIQELHARRRSLHAYVEEDVERDDGGERRGDV